MRKKLSILATFVGILAIGGWLIACNNCDELAIQNNNDKQEMEISAEAWEEFAKEFNDIDAQLTASIHKTGAQTRTVSEENKLYDRVETLISNFMTKYAIDEEYESICGTDTTSTEEPDDSLALASKDQLDMVLAHSSKAFAEIATTLLNTHTLNLSDKDIIMNKELRNIEKLKLLIINSSLKNRDLSLIDTDGKKKTCDEKYKDAQKECDDDYNLAILAACNSGSPSIIGYLIASSEKEKCYKKAKEDYEKCKKKEKKSSIYHLENLIS